MIWVSSVLASTVCISAIVLSIQRGLYHKRQIAQEEGSISLSEKISHIKEDYKRDLSVPYADTNRITRITYFTLLLTTLAAFDLKADVDHVKDRSDGIYYIASSLIVFISWLYACVLAILSRRYRLPNTWGWILNVHLFVIFVAAWSFTLYRFWQIMVIASPSMGWIESLPFVLPVILIFDLIYVTGTTKQGPPFLDEDDRQVCNVNVDSIIGQLFFQWTTPIINNVAAKGADVTDIDLPPLTSGYRAHNIFYTFGETRGKGSLFYRILKGNSAPIIAQVTIALATSIMYYAPAFFMNRLLQYLQDVSDGILVENGMKHGALIVIGMGVSILVLGVLVGQLWYYGNYFLI